MHKLLRRIFLGSEEGQTAVIIGMLLPVLFGIAALAIEVGHVYMVKNQLQVTADAAALAAVRELVADDLAGARNQVAGIVGSNKVANQTLSVDLSNDVEFGRWERGLFTATLTAANAVRVTVRKTKASPNGAVQLLIAPVIGFDSVDVSASAIATLANIDLMLVIDRSGSMDDDTQYRWERYWDSRRRRWRWRRVIVGGLQPMDTLRAAAKTFITDLDAEVDQVGIVSYSSAASSPIEQVLSSNLSAGVAAIDNIPNPSGWTHIGDGLDRAILELRSSRVRGSTVKIIILLSDGAPTCRANGSCGSSTWYKNEGRDYARQKADEAKSYNFIIHTISLGSGADRTLMQDLASRAGGEEFFAATGSGLSQVFQLIRERIPVRLAS